VLCRRTCRPRRDQWLQRPCSMQPRLPVAGRPHAQRPAHWPCPPCYSPTDHRTGRRLVAGRRMRSAMPPQSRDWLQTTERVGCRRRSRRWRRMTACSSLETETPSALCRPCPTTATEYHQTHSFYTCTFAASSKFYYQIRRQFAKLVTVKDSVIMSCALCMHILNLQIFLFI